MHDAGAADGQVLGAAVHDLGDGAVALALALRERQPHEAVLARAAPLAAAVAPHVLPVPLHAPRHDVGHLVGVLTVRVRVSVRVRARARAIGLEPLRRRAGLVDQLRVTWAGLGLGLWLG